MFLNFKKMLPVFLVLITIIPAGCLFNQDKTASSVKINNDIKKPEVPEKTPPVKEVPRETPTEEPNTQTDTKPTGPSDINPNTGATSSKSLAWWITRIPNAAPGIDNNFAKLMKRYNGIYIGNTSKKQVALTFDVGDAGNSSVPALLDMLKKHNVKANFFVTGQWVEQNPLTFRRIVSEGHLIGNHSYSHPDLTKVTLDQVAEQIEKTNKLIIANGGEKPIFFRPPFGYFSETVLNKIYSMGYYSTFWGISMRDWLPMTQEELVHGVVDYLHNGAIALIHVTPDGVKALDTTIPEIESRGYQIVTLDELIR